MFPVALYRSQFARKPAVDVYFILPCVLKVLSSCIGLGGFFFSFIQSLYAYVGERVELSHRCLVPSIF